MKYIIFEVVTSGGVIIELPIVFPNCINHDTMAKVMIHSTYKDMNGGVVGKVVSAGFCDMHTLTCSGESETLGIGSRDSDALVVAMCDTFGYVPLEDIFKTNPCTGIVQEMLRKKN